MVEGKPRMKYRGAEVIAAEDACDAARSSRTCACWRQMFRCCRSRPVIALRPASASIGTSTIGAGYSRVASSMLPATEASSGACGAGSATVTTRRVVPRLRARSPARTAESPARGRALAASSVTLSSLCGSSRQTDQPQPSSVSVSGSGTLTREITSVTPVPGVYEPRRVNGSGQRL